MLFFVFPALLSGPERLRGERWGLSGFQQLSRHKLTWDISCVTGLAMVWAQFHKELSETLSISEICFVFTTQKEREEISGQWIGQASAALLPISATYKVCDRGQIIRLSQSRRLLHL